MSPTTIWLDSTGIASFQITVTGAHSATLAEGIYRIQTLVTHAGATGVILDGRLEVAPQPGTTAAKLAFTNLSNLIDFCPWLETVQSDNEQFAFTRQQARATTKLIDALCNLWKPQNMYPTAGQPGFGPAHWYAYQQGPSLWMYAQLVPLVPNSSVPAPYVNLRLDTQPSVYDASVSTNLLLKDHVKEICAKWAIAFVLRAQLGRDDNKSWFALANTFEREADNLFRATRFGIDMSNPQTGWYGITIDGGSTNVR